MKYKLENREKLASLLLMTVLLMTMLAIVIFDERVTVKVNCYDRYGNKIIGELCEGTTSEFEDIGTTSGILLILSTIAYGFSSLIEYESNMFGYISQTSSSASKEKLE